MMTDLNNTTKPRGIALLAVLIVIVAITIISFSFIARSDGELAYGQNMKLHTQADYLAESGLAQAKALILNPQDIDLGSGEYWAGASAQQLDSGNLYYDVSVRRHSSGATPSCSFDVTATAYKLAGESRTAESSFQAELRLDPCVGLWIGGDAALGTAVAVYGDVYCDGSLIAARIIYGDIFSAGTITADATGHEYPLSPTPIEWPPVTCDKLGPAYYSGSGSCFATVVDVNAASGYAAVPGAGNPMGVVYHSGDLELTGPTNLTGALVVTGDLTIRGYGNVIGAVRNHPAVIVGGRIKIESDSSLAVNGLIVVGQTMDIPPSVTNVQVTIDGGLFVAQGSTMAPGAGSSITISANHSRTALMLITGSGTRVTWRQVGSAFYKNLQRLP